MKILIAEDDKNLRDLLFEQLTGEGYSVISASNGKEAYDLFIGESPDPAILDIMTVGNLRMDFTNGIIEKNGKPVNLNAKEYHILKYLSENAGNGGCIKGRAAYQA